MPVQEPAVIHFLMILVVNGIACRVKKQIAQAVGNGVTAFAGFYPAVKLYGRIRILEPQACTPTEVPMICFFLRQRVETGEKAEEQE